MVKSWRLVFGIYIKISLQCRIGQQSKIAQSPVFISTRKWMMYSICHGGGHLRGSWPCGHVWIIFISKLQRQGQPVLMPRLCLTHTDREGTSDNHSSCLNTRRNSTGPRNIKACRAVQGDVVIKWIFPAWRGCVLLWCVSLKESCVSCLIFCCMISWKWPKHQ